jgi:diaminopimelate decarboxylase/aspartate kinase
VSRPWIVLKFGGTSLATAERWGQVRNRLDRLLPTHRVWLVASAVSGVSNALERAVHEARERKDPLGLEQIRAIHRDLARDLGLTAAQVRPLEELLDRLEDWLAGIRLTGEAPPRLVARVMSIGELASTLLGESLLASQGVNVRWIDARQLLRAVAQSGDNDRQRYQEARVPPISNAPAADQLAAAADVVITQGFIAGNAEGETCLLGRGGSDTSGALFAALLGADELQIWTDVPGMFTADPRLVPEARLIRQIGYREAQELAAMGARVLHPRCLEPVAGKGIPLSIHSTLSPEGPGTRIEASDEEHPAVTAVTCRKGVTLVTLSTMEMWRSPGFLARVFAPFEELGISVDLVATSQSAISVTLDGVPEGGELSRLIERLEEIGKVEVVHPCGVVSVVGRRIRTALHELGAAMEVFQERPVYLVSDSADDLNLSFVVDEDQASTLVTRLHERLFAAQRDDARLGPTWEVLGGGRDSIDAGTPWWRGRATELCDLVDDGEARFVYHLPTVIEQARRLRVALPSVERLYYSMKANSNPRVLETVAAEGFGIECVSAAEVNAARALLGDRVPLLFTPNFCPMAEYRTALEAGAELTIDGPQPLEADPDLFRGVEIGLRVDPGYGQGHHTKVWTAGARAKFGHARDEIDALAEAAGRAQAKVVGLHAHVGSGIHQAAAWAVTARALAPLIGVFTEVSWLDLGGGLGVPERPGQGSLDLAEVEAALADFRRDHPALDIRLEPGRFLVSQAGVLLCPVTQVRRKGTVRFIGLATGMNSLIRPALYGAWHAIHNLTRPDDPPTGYWNVVGPICETSDVLGSDRLLPDTHPGDVMLIENAGAYGAVMGSRYNMREPAAEIVIEA